MAPLKAGVIGAGILGTQHATYLAKRSVQVVGIADVRREAAERLAAQVSAQAFTRYEEMFIACKPDLVVVATPDPFHRAPSVAALEAGIPNIIQEKPLATTLEDAEAIYNLVEQRRARFFVNYANRAAPMDIATCHVIREGLLGKVVYGESRLDDNISVPTQMWGDRTREWAGGSSTAHFLLSHVVDLLRWYFSPAEVREVYAISQRQVLGYTPDVYDAYLMFDSGLKVRVKAEWIKHIDELVEFYMCFSGSEGTLIYNKRGGFNTLPGWRANLSGSLTVQDLLAQQEALAVRGANVRALVHQPSPTTGWLSAGSGKTMLSLEYQGLGYGDPEDLVGCFLESIEKDTLTPPSWKGPGSLPTHEDGLKQTQITCAIVESAEAGRVVAIGS